MKTIEVKKLNSEKIYPAMAEVSDKLDELGEGHAIETVNWETFPYKPGVKFNLHGETAKFTLNIMSGRQMSRQRKH